MLDNYIVYYINLTERIDRNNHIKQELSKIFPEEKINRINGRTHTNGAVGCTQSHADTLIQFIKSEKEICFVFEDDFQFMYPKDEVLEMLNSLSSNLFNCILLSYNSLGIDLDLSTLNNKMCKFKNGRTTAGYMVHKSYARKLLDNVLDGVMQLIKTNNKKLYAIDMYWMSLQNEFHACVPCLGTQYTNYSNIENKITDYFQCNTCVLLLICPIDQYNKNNFEKCPFIHIHINTSSINNTNIIASIKSKYPHIKYLFKTNELKYNWAEIFTVYKFMLYEHLIGKYNSHLGHKFDLIEVVENNKRPALKIVSDYNMLSRDYFIVLN